MGLSWAVALLCQPCFWGMGHGIMLTQFHCYHHIHRIVPLVVDNYYSQGSVDCGQYMNSLNFLLLFWVSQPTLWSWSDMGPQFVGESFLAVTIPASLLVWMLYPMQCQIWTRSHSIDCIHLTMWLSSLCHSEAMLIFKSLMCDMVKFIFSCLSFQGSIVGWSLILTREKTQSQRTSPLWHQNRTFKYYYPLECTHPFCSQAMLHILHQFVC